MVACTSAMTRIGHPNHYIYRKFSLDFYNETLIRAKNPKRRAWSPMGRRLGIDTYMKSMKSCGKRTSFT